MHNTDPKMRFRPRGDTLFLYQEYWPEEDEDDENNKSEEKSSRGKPWSTDVASAEGCAALCQTSGGV